VQGNRRIGDATSADTRGPTSDGECRNTSTPGERLVVELERGLHHVLIQKPGFRNFSTDVDARVRAMASLNVSLSAEGKD